MSKAARQHRSPALFLVAAIALAAAGCTTKPLVDPRPVATSSAPEQTRVVILRALLENNWTVESEQPGEIIASYARSGWNMAVSIGYADQISIRYLSSDNLNYEISDDGTARIHRGYNLRVRRLSQEIEREMRSASLTDSLPPVAAPPAAAPAAVEPPVAEPPVAESEPQ